MCRFLVYRGRELLLSDLLTKSEQSLIRQSYRAREREEPLNGDGFGMGWYVQDIDPDPCVFTSVRPAWNNRNVRRLADKLKSDCVFAHVRAASQGAAVSELNCHPFRFGRLLWMHNGWIPDFNRVRRRIRDRLDDEFFNLIEGTTDSEHAFALFLHLLRRESAPDSIETMSRTLGETIRQLEEIAGEAGIEQPCYFNFAVTDGVRIVASRYVTDPEARPESLYLARGQSFRCEDGHYDMTPAGDRAGAVIIASEPLTDDRDDWEAVPRNHLVTVSDEFDVEFVACA